MLFACSLACLQCIRWRTVICHLTTESRSCLSLQQTETTKLVHIFRLCFCLTTFVMQVGTTLKASFRFCWFSVRFCFYLFSFAEIRLFYWCSPDQDSGVSYQWLFVFSLVCSLLSKFYSSVVFSIICFFFITGHKLWSHRLRVCSKSCITFSLKHHHR